MKLDDKENTPLSELSTWQINELLHGRPSSVFARALAVNPDRVVSLDDTWVSVAHLRLASEVFNEWRQTMAQWRKTDKRKVREAIVHLYKLKKVPPPRRIQYFDSPTGLPMLGGDGGFRDEYSAFRSVVGNVYTQKIAEAVASLCTALPPLNRFANLLATQMPAFLIGGMGITEALFAVDFMCRVLGILPSQRLACVLQIARYSGGFASYISSGAHNCCVVDKPLYYKWDEERRPHNDVGACIEWADGTAYYALQGILVPPEVIMFPESLDPMDVLMERNVERRRVMIDHIGYPRIFRDVAPFHSDGYGDLFKLPVPGMEPMVVVKVLNSTAESDGSYKDYFLRVPPNMQTAEDAVAWTFGYEQGEYVPMVEA